jgi:xylose isomerase
MNIKYSLLLGFLGELSDRFMTYGERRTVAERFALVADIPGVSGVEIVYPYDLGDLAEVVAACKQHGLAVASVNLNVKKEDRFRYGSFTHRDPGIRAEAVEWLKRAMDTAAELGAEVVTCCPLNDGYDYAFERDYARAWDWLLASVDAAAGHRDDVLVSLEYKPSEPRARMILDSAAKALNACFELGRANVGVTMDMGHALYTGESSAEAAAMLARSGKLFLVHVNDNYRNWDWDLIAGSVNWWDLVELMYVVRKAGYGGWFAADVFPNRVSVEKAFGTTYKMMWAANRLIDTVGLSTISDLVDQGQPPDVLERLIDEMIPGFAAAYPVPEKK